MICRIWHGWTAPERAEAYEHLLREEIFVGIAERAIGGFRGIELVRRETEGRFTRRRGGAERGRGARLP